MWGIGFGVVIWAVAQFFALRLIDPTMASHINLVVFLGWSYYVWGGTGFIY